MRFWMPWGIAAAVHGVVLCFFIAGLMDGSVSSFNIALWAVILAGVTGVTGGSLVLKRNGRPGLGALLAMVLAVPGLVAAFFVLILVVTQPRWN